MKKIISIFTMFLAGIMISSCVFTLTSCGEKNGDTEIKGEFYSLKDVYENGEITRQDLLSIVYYANGGIIESNKNQYPEDFVSTPKNPEELDANTERIIKNTYKYLLKKENEKYYSDVIIEARYYGTYNDYICVGIKIEIPGVDHGAVALTETIIGGVSYFLDPNDKVILYKI